MLEFQQTMSKHNRLRKDNLVKVFQTLWQHPGLSRAELARRLRLDRSTTGQLADKLMEMELLEQEQDTSSGPQGGRPPVRLRIRPGYGFSVGVELTFPDIRLVATDLCGEMLEYREVPVKPEGPESLVTLVDAVKGLSRSVQASTASERGLLGIGIGASALVDSSKNTIIRSDALKFKGPFDLSTLDFNSPILVLNDAHACAVGEIHLQDIGELLLAFIEFRPGRKVQDTGVGVGLVINRKLRHGRAVTHLLRPDSGSRPENRQEFLDGLGQSLALIANSAGIPDIVLAGNAEELFESLEDSILRHAVGPDQDPRIVTVRHTQLGSRAVAIGACYSIIDHLFSQRQIQIFSDSDVR